MEGFPLLDAHVHLDWAADPAQVAREAAEMGLGLVCCTVGPDGYKQARDVFAEHPNVAVAAGLHPWHVEGADVALAAENARAARFVGEVGLDFGNRHARTRELQLSAFSAICAACAQEGGKVLSIHSVRAAGVALDVLARTGALKNCACVFHWFSGSSGELRRAVDAGCWFSVGERMLATRRGREYARQVPADRLLFETDLPEAPDQEISAADIAASLGRAAAQVEAVRGNPPTGTDAFLGTWRGATCHTHAG